MGQEYRLVLVDGSSYLFRAYHALPQLVSSKGQPTGAIKGVVNMVRKLITDYPQSRLAVVFDAKGKTFRDDLYPQYKANRPPMPDELRSQIAPLHKIIRLMGLPLLSVEGVEADDVIGTLARQATEAGVNTLISTSDKDLAQLVNPHVTLIDTMSASLLDEAGVVQKFGVRPDQMIDYLALVGDASDNIPGVPKCGAKTAAKWLADYGTLQGVMDHADAIPGKVGENLRASLDFLPLSYQLATIKTDVPLQEGLDALLPQAGDSAALLETYKELEFKSLVTELTAAGRAAPAKAADTQAANYQTLLTEAELDEWIARLKAADCFALDTETTSLSYMSADLVGVSFCCEAGSAAYVPCGHDYLGAPKQLPAALVLEKLGPLLEDPARLVIGQNLKYDMSVLARAGIHWQARTHDTMLESYVLNSVASRHGLDDLALKYLGHTSTRYEDIAGKGKGQLGFSQVTLDKAGPYAAEDADLAFRLHQALWPKLQAEPRLAAVYAEMELPLVAVLSRMERNGVLLDEARLAQQSKELAQRVQELEAEAHQLAGKAFNLGSTQQLQKILFEEQKIEPRKKTPGGKPSTAEPVLAELALDHPLPKVIMEHRRLAKLKSTYTDQLPKQINAESGRVHTSYHQAVAATGRLSSADPNLQNIPIRTEEGRRVRRAFIAPPGCAIIAADYSQIELRIMAHLSEDPGLIAAFNDGLDIHRATAAEVFGTRFEDVSSEERRRAKAINFGLIYGMSAFGLARQLGIEQSAARQYMEDYFKRYPGVLDYMERTRKLAAEQGYVETLFGRRLYLPEIKASNFQRRQGAERAAINAPMQGTAADIIKRAMIAVDAWLQEAEPDAKMTMQVHDELVLEAPEARVDAICEGLVARMAKAAELAIPLVVETGVGKDWDEAH